MNCSSATTGYIIMKELEEKRQALFTWAEETGSSVEIVPRSLLRDEEFNSSVTVTVRLWGTLSLASLFFFSVNDALCSQSCIFLIAEPSSLQIGEILIIRWKYVVCELSGFS